MPYCLAKGGILSAPHEVGIMDTLHPWTEGRVACRAIQKLVQPQVILHPSGGFTGLRIYGKR